MKKTLCIILLASLYIGSAFAIETGTNDCSIVSLTKDGNYTSFPNQKYQNIFTQDALKKSFDNLRAACCKREIKELSCDGIDIEGTFPDSLFLFDHLLDVYLRRLDAKGKDDNGEDLMYGLTADEKGKLRRDSISQIGNNSDGTPPLQIKQLYEQYRTGTKYLPKYNDDNTQKDNTTRKNSVSGNIAVFGEWTLLDRYNNACDLITYMYLDITKNMEHRKDTLDTSTRQAKLKNIYNSCTNLINNRVSSERIYTEAIAQERGNAFLDNNIDAYLNVYFLNNELTSLQSIIHNRQNTFAEIVKSISKLVKKCS